MQLWTSSDYDPITIQDLHTPPRVYAKTIAMKPSQKTMSDFYPYHDVFIYLAHGTCSLHTENGTEKFLRAGDGVILPPSIGYWFMTSQDSAKILEISLGEDEQDNPHEHQHIHGWTHQSMFVLEGPEVCISGSIHQHAMDQYGQTEEILDLQDLGKKQDISSGLKTVSIPRLS